MQSYMYVPGYYPEIIKMIRSADWLMHNFHSENIDIYDATAYRYNKQFEGTEYNVILDVNFLQYSLNIVKRKEPNDSSRIAAAYLTFFQIADVRLDPTILIYEKINYSSEQSEEAISALEQFRGIDNSSTDDLAAYALGYKKQLQIEPIPCEDRDHLRQRLLEYRRLTNWDSLYLSILAITNISTNTSIPRPKKLPAFLEWCISDFRFSLAALVYASVLFGHSPAKKMMKYKTTDSDQDKQKALSNMTWDLYYVDRYMEYWVSKDEKTENLMLSADGGLRLTMQLAVKCQSADNLKPLQPHIKKEFQKIENAYENRNSGKRIYQSAEWDYDYRQRLIAKYESKLLKTENKQG